MHVLKSCCFVKDEQGKLKYNYDFCLHSTTKLKIISYGFCIFYSITLLLWLQSIFKEVCFPSCDRTATVWSGAAHTQYLPLL